jgi:DNA-binding NarL/FixJ family response regulator
MGPIKVVIADDHTLFREGLKRVLSVDTEILVVGEASDTMDAVQVVARMRPDILLLDLKMPSGDTDESLRRVAECSPTTKVIILTAHSEKENLLSTARARARGYVLKGVSVPTLVEAIKKVNAGAIWVDRELTAGDDFERIARSLPFEVAPPANETINNLTKRELEILQLVAEGLSNDEIGKKIFISTKTVKTHLTNIFDKLEVNNRFKAALCVMPKPLKRSAPP